MAAQWLRPVLPTQGPEFDPRVTSRLAELISPLSAHRTITPHHKEKSPLHIFFQPTLFKLLALQVSKSTFLARTPVLRNPSLGGEERRKGSGAAGGSRACRPPALRAEASGTPRPPLTKEPSLPPARSQSRGLGHTPASTDQVWRPDFCILNTS